MTPLYDVAKAAAERHGVTVEDMQGDKRGGAINLARKDYYDVALSFDYTRKQIGALVNRDPSTVSHHLNGRPRTPGGLRWRLIRTKRLFCQPAQYKWR